MLNNNPTDVMFTNMITNLFPLKKSSTVVDVYSINLFNLIRVSTNVTN